MFSDHRHNPVSVESAIASDDVAQIWVDGAIAAGQVSPGTESQVRSDVEGMIFDIYIAVQDGQDCPHVQHDDAIDYYMDVIAIERVNGRKVKRLLVEWEDSESSLIVRSHNRPRRKRI